MSAVPDDLPRGISRFEHGRTRGFLVRIPKSGKRLRKLFSYGVHQGELGAFLAALAWRDAQLEGESPGPRVRKRVPGYGYIQRTRRSYRTEAGELRQYEAFVAWFWDDAGPRSTSWSIEQHGEATAYEACEDWLAEQRGRLPAPTLARAG